MQGRDNFLKKKSYKGRKKNYMDKPHNIPKYFVGILHVGTSSPHQIHSYFPAKSEIGELF